MARTRRATATTTPETATPVTETSTPTMTPADIEKAIADGVAAGLEANARNSGTSLPLGGSGTSVPRKCTYKDFIGCQPTFYKGTEGVTGLTQWFE